jgi:hypothetical protein
VLLTANSPSDVPEAWLATCRDPLIINHFRLQLLRRAHKASRSARGKPASDPPRAICVLIPGRHLVDFLTDGSGPVTVYRRAAVVSQAA